MRCGEMWGDMGRCGRLKVAPKGDHLARLAEHDREVAAARDGARAAAATQRHRARRRAVGLVA